MKATKYTPNHYSMYYILDDVKKTFREYRLSNYEMIALSEQIRTEKNNGDNSISGAENILKVKDKSNWSKCISSGLHPAGKRGFYYGDLKVMGSKSLFIAYIPEDWEAIYIRICPQFYTSDTSNRKRIVQKIIRVMLDDMNEKGND